MLHKLRLLKLRLLKRMLLLRQMRCFLKLLLKLLLRTG